MAGLWIGWQYAMTEPAKRQLTLHELSQATGYCANTIKRLVALGLPTIKISRTQTVIWDRYVEFMEAHFGPEGDLRGQVDLSIKF